ncbi:MAG: NfeD family protein [Panacagrimonas sp.]
MDELLYWHWWVGGLALLILEMFIPTGFVLLWMGASAILVGGIAWLAPELGWQVQASLFGLLSLFSFFVYKRFRPAPTPTDAPSLNRRGESYVGRQFTLTQPIVNGVGKLRVDDSHWRITGPDAPSGSRVKVIAADGATLKVEREG